MKSAIFLRELRVGLLQEIVAASVVLVVLAAAGWLAVSVFDEPVSEMKEALSLFLIVLIALLAFSSGARASTAEARQRQEMFLYSLPVSRGALWLSMVGGRLAASLPMATLLFLAGFLLSGPQIDLPLKAVGLTLYAVLFAAGNCLALLFRRDPAAYLTGILIVPFIVSQSLAFTNEGFSSEFLPEPLSNISLGLLSAAFLWLSWFYFQRGEILIRARQLTNLILLGVTLALFLLFVGAVTQSPLLDRLAGPWAHGLEPQDPLQKWETSTARLVSPGGRYLAVVEHLSARPGVSRVTIVETATGRRIGRYRWRGFGWVSWDARNEVLRILCRDRAIPFFWKIDGLNTASDWVWLTPEGRELAHHRFEPIQEAVALQDGSYLLQDSSSRVRLVRWGGSKDVRVLAEVPEAASMIPWRGQGVLVTHRSDRRMVLQIMNGVALPALDLDAFLEPHLSFLRESEGKFVPWLLMSGTDRLLRQPIFGGVSLPDKLALYIPRTGARFQFHLYDGSLDREIPLPACSDRSAVAPELIPTRSSLAFLVRYQCFGFGDSGKNLQHRHFYYLPGSGSPKALSALDQVMEGEPILLAYLDERTAIWRPEKGETWKILRDGQIRTLWPPQTPLD